MILAMFGEANDSSIWGASWFFALGGCWRCCQLLGCFFVVIEYIITESLGMMSVFVSIGYEIGPEMGLRIRIFSGFEHIQIVHGYSRKYCTW